MNAIKDPKKGVLKLKMTDTEAMIKGAAKNGKPGTP